MLTRFIFLCAFLSSFFVFVIPNSFANFENTSNYDIGFKELTNFESTSESTKRQATDLKASIARPQSTNPDLDNFPLIAKNRKPIITVGYEKGFGILSDDTSYDAKGLGYDLLNKIGHFTDIEFKFIEIKGSLFEAVENGIVDIAGFYSKTPEREKIAAFSKLPVDILQIALTTKGDKNYYYSNPKSIDGKTVASYPGNPGEEILNNYLKSHNISVNYIYDDVMNYDKLDADFYIMVSDKKNSETFYTVLNLSLKNLYFFAKKENEKLINYIDSIFYDFILNNYGAYNTLVNKYKIVGNEYQNRSLTKEEADLFINKTFKVGYVENHAPFQYTDLMGEPAGIAVEYISNLAKKYGFQLEFVPYNLNNSWSAFEDLDILIGLIGERNHISRFYTGTDPYSSLNLNILFQENFSTNYENENLQLGLPANAEIGILNFINFKYSEFFEKYPNVKIVHFVNTNDLVEAFQKEQIKAIVTTDLGANAINSITSETKMQNSLNLPLAMNFQISNKLENTYLELFNIIINKESKEHINQITSVHTAEFLPDFGSQQFFQKNKYFIISALLFLLIAFVFLILLIRQRSKISTLAKDSLTPLISISHFTEQVDKRLASAKLNEYEIIMLDIDYFRMINNYYGTDKGSEVILSMAKSLLEAYKNTDTLITRRVAEQFLIFKKVDRLEGGMNIVEAVNSHIIPKIKSIVGENYSLKMSVGICKNSERNETVTDLLDNAIVAHLKAKKEHKVSFAEFNSEMRQEANTMLDIIYRMEHALENKEFKVHYQPKIDFENMKIIGAEALIRWIPPIGKAIFPNDFIPVMEKNGFISQLEIYVFDELCSFISKNKNNVKLPKIAINLSPITLSKPALLKEMVELLKKYKVHPSQIEVEITESALGDFEESLPKIIKILHKIGFSVAMDDFGAGNSSLNRLSMIEVDVLKLDKVFLDFHEDSPRGSLVVQQVIVLAKQLGMKIVAEGIENINQAKWLREIKCDIAQGFYFAKPLNEKDFTELILQNKVYSI